ncbi:50S ribosomal protein L10 [Metallumcola ferriviriculae]|uniref:Large ribosomal subunit protein uL10 n=1 Tax=Metallumcola ferriviriculae TaxID=3039180 RepID=A0AAU0UKI8_9FIRM|nr:50S ribosomal protein L10 [Desulfitibacteraceae bacterium MK1]
MNKQRQQKVQVVEEIKAKLDKVRGAVLTDYRGLNVAEMTELRAKLREANVEYKVLKNTLVTIAAQDLGLGGLNPYLEGPTAIAFGVEDAVSPAKVLSKFAKDHKQLEIKAGILEGKVIGVEEVKALADLPSREELLAQVVRGMQAPMAGLANVLQGSIRNLAYVLEAVRKEKEQTA